jgi:hypothetical protein
VALLPIWFATKNIELENWYLFDFEVAGVAAKGIGQISVIQMH